MDSPSNGRLPRASIPFGQVSLFGLLLRSARITSDSRFLKDTILASLEDNGLIHKTFVLCPLETEEELMAAVKKAESENRKMERRHARLGLPPPPVKRPATVKRRWGWLLGPRQKGKPPVELRAERQRAQAQQAFEEEMKKQEKERVQAIARAKAEEEGREWVESDERVELPPHLAESYQPSEAQYVYEPFDASSRQRVREKPIESTFGPVQKQVVDAEGSDEVDENGVRYGWKLPPILEDARAATYEVDEGKWVRAQRAEFQYHRVKIAEAEAAAQRQILRRMRAYEQLRTKMAQRLEDQREGITEAMQKEQRRLQAIEDIRLYAQTTGEDVSDWLDELSAGPVGDSPDYVPQHQIHGGAIPRNLKNPRSRMRPLGFPIN